MLTAKNSAMYGNHLVNGIARGFRKNGGWEVENWLGQENRAAMRNWLKVIRVPRDSQQRGRIVGSDEGIPLSGSSLVPTISASEEALQASETHFTIVSKAKT